MDRLRVCVVGNRLASTAPSGVDRYFRELVAALDDRLDVRGVVASAREREAPGDWIPPDMRVHVVRGPRKLVHLTWSILGRPRVDRHLDTDLVHVAVPSFPVPSAAPVVYTFHDLMPIEHPAWFSIGHRLAFRRCVADAQQRNATIITGSRRTAADLVRIGFPSARVHVTPYGVSQRFLDGVDDDRACAAARKYGLDAGRFVLYVGQVTNRKNVDVLIRAARRLPAALDLAIAGAPGPDSATTLERARANDRVRMLGFVDDADLPALMAAARVVAHPSEFEGFGFTPLEAMAVGAPVVVSAGGALPEIVGDAAAVVDRDEPEAWAAAISALAVGHERESLIDRGRHRAQQFTWARTAALSMEVYRDVLRAA